MEINETGGLVTSDKLIVIGNALTYGAALTVTVVAAATLYRRRDFPTFLMPAARWLFMAMDLPLSTPI